MSNRMADHPLFQAVDNNQMAKLKAHLHEWDVLYSHEPVTGTIFDRAVKRHDASLRDTNIIIELLRHGAGRVRFDYFPDSACGDTYMDLIDHDNNRVRYEQISESDPIYRQYNQWMSELVAPLSIEVITWRNNSKAGLSKHKALDAKTMMTLYSMGNELDKICSHADVWRAIPEKWLELCLSVPPHIRGHMMQYNMQLLPLGLRPHFSQMAEVEWQGTIGDAPAQRVTL